MAKLNRSNDSKNPKIRNCVVFLSSLGKKIHLNSSVHVSSDIFYVSITANVLQSGIVVVFVTASGVSRELCSSGNYSLGDVDLEIDAYRLIKKTSNELRSDLLRVCGEFQ